LDVKELESTDQSWQLKYITKEGDVVQPGATPVLEGIVQKHGESVENSLFSAIILSYLSDNGLIKPHYGPTNLRLR
jgi:hypothetical protein